MFSRTQTTLLTLFFGSFVIFLYGPVHPLSCWHFKDPRVA